jgi:GAF domain-containing protein
MHNTGRYLSHLGSRTRPLMATAGRDLDVLLKACAGGLGALTLMSLGQILVSTNPQAPLYASLESAALLATLGLWRLNRRGRTALSAYLFIAGLLVFITFAIEPAWLLASPALITYIMPIGIAGLLFGPRAGFVACTAVTALVTLRAVMGLAVDPDLPLDPFQLILGLLALYFLAVINWRSASNLLQALGTAQHSAAEAQALSEQLQEYASELEESQRQLARRAGHLEAAAQVAGVATATLDQQQLLTQTANLISQRFGFYHTGIFLLDERGEWATLHAASSAGGGRMLARGTRVRAGQTGLLGQVTDLGAPQIAPDVALDPGYADNPDLPDTRSAAALPLRARGKIIGVLDVQSTQPDAFTEEDLAVLQTLADQVAMALSNARLFQEAQENLEAVHRAYGQISQEAWTQLLRAQPELGFRRDRRGLSPLSTPDQPVAEAEDASTGTLAKSKDGTKLVRPVQVRDQIVGVINARKSDESGPWTPAEVSLLETLVGQLEVALEGARLYGESQRRAHHERLARQITEKVRATPDIQSIAQTAAVELVEALSGTRGFVQLGVDRVPERSGVGRVPERSGVETHDTDAALGTDGQPQIQFYTHPQADPASVGWEPPPEANQVLNEGITIAIAGEDSHVPTLVTPIKLRGRVIGALGLQDANAARVWSAEEIALVETIADQVAQALETAHLLDETQRRARREQLVTEITGRIRSAPDIDGILRAAVQEMRRVLGVSHALIRLGTETHLRPLEDPGLDIRDSEGEQLDE